jgi:hypothetical protein
MTKPVALSLSDSQPADRASYPISFTVRDDDGQAVLTITDDPAEQHAHLEISNTSGADILIDVPAGAAIASAAQHHFELRFRPGALSSVSQTSLRVEGQDGWSASSPQRQPDGTTSVYLLSTSRTTLSPATPVRLRLSQISADGGGGARGTQLELRYRGLRYPDGTPLADMKLLHIDLVNQRGKKAIPLHVGFVGPRTILNDGHAVNRLTLRITNISTTELRLTGQSSPAASTFIISFDVDENWGLASKAVMSSMSIEAVDGVKLEEADWDVQPGRQLGQGLAWRLMHKKADAVLAPGQVIQLQLGNIVSSLPSGDTNLYLRYENIPGYWDGQFVCTIEKAPIRYDDRGNVGIGTATPARKLQVGDDAGGVGVEPAGQPSDGTYLRFGDNTGRKLHIARSREASNGALNTGTTGALVTVQDGGNVGVGTDSPPARLTVQADSTATTEGRQIVVQGHADSHNELAIGYHTQRNYGSIQAVTQGTALRPLLLNPAGGGVGVGLTRNPTAALEVNGGIRSPMWQAHTVFLDQTGPLPLTSGSFTTGGGTLLLFVAGSAWRATGGLIGLWLQIGSVGVGDLKMSINPANQRTPLVGTLIATGIPAGSHRMTIQILPDAPATLTDVNDLFNVTLLELPF